MKTLNIEDLEELEEQFEQDVENWRGDEPEPELVEKMREMVDVKNKDKNLRFEKYEEELVEEYPLCIKFITSCFAAQRALAKELLYD